MDNINQQFLFSLAIILLGYIARQKELIRQQDSEGLSRIVFNITLPALIITAFSQIEIDLSLMLLTFSGAFYGTLMLFLALVIFRKEARTMRGMLSMCLPGFNIGLFAYPLVEVVWGHEGLKYFGMFDIGNSFVLLGLCYLVAGYFSPQSSGADLKMIIGKLLRSIPLLSYITAFIIVVAGLRIPQPILGVTSMLAKANMPLSLLLLGFNLSFSMQPEYWRHMSKVIVLRYVIGAVVGASLYFLVPFEGLVRYTLLLGFLMPIGLSVIPFAVEFNYDQAFIGTMNNITILISFALTWSIVGALP